jgi:hypothetical protein
MILARHEDVLSRDEIVQARDGKVSSRDKTISSRDKMILSHDEIILAAGRSRRGGHFIVANAEFPGRCPPRLESAFIRVDPRPKILPAGA